MMQRLLADSVRFASFRIRYVIDSVLGNYPAAQAGVLPGDSIIELDGKSLSFSDFRMAMMERKQNEAKLIKEGNDPRQFTLTYVRGGVTDTLNVRVDSTYMMGVTACVMTDRLMPMVEKEYTFFESFPGRSCLGSKNARRLCGQHEISFLERRCKAVGWFRYNRKYFPGYVGLASVLVHDGFPFHYSGFHEYLAYSGIGWRTRALPAL